MQQRPENDSEKAYSLTSCENCMNLYDGRYCTKWRDVVPEDARKTGCEEIDQFPPF